jgi:hypothetical protein
LLASLRYRLQRSTMTVSTRSDSLTTQLYVSLYKARSHRPSIIFSLWKSHLVRRTLLVRRYLQDEVKAMCRDEFALELVAK